MKELKFKISSGLKDIIGKELITNDLIAIFELVKNSYDANAKSVKIIFQNVSENADSKKARIVVVDDGNGMSYDDVINKFLFVGYSDKRDAEREDYRDKIQKRRFFAGAKGIGRFSCDRLGTKLNMYTKKADENTIHHLYIDWKKFEIDQKKEFEIIHPEYSEENKVVIDGYSTEVFKKGTILVIDDLNDTWEWDKLLKLKRYLQRLINPSQLNDSSAFKIVLIAKEFEDDDKHYAKMHKPWNVINGIVKNFIFEDLGIKTTEINSKISEDGMNILTEVRDKGRFVFSLKEKNRFLNLRNIKVKIFYLNTTAKAAFTRNMGIEPVRYGSIFLYKNGVRIHPYGDENDDWLGLERRKTQGTKRYLSSREVMGRIEIYGNQPEFIEVSSRDGGIIKNQQYEELKEFFMKKVIRRLERYVVEGLNWDKEESQKSEVQIKEDSLMIIAKIAGRGEDTEVRYNPSLLEIVKKKEVEKIPELIKNLESINEHVKDKKIKEYADIQLKSFRSAMNLLQREKRNVEEDLEVEKKESLFLTKVLSTDEEMKVNLIHTIENCTPVIKDAVKSINEKINANSPINEIIPFIDDISKENEKITLSSSLVSLANFNMKVEWINKNVILYIKEYLERIARNRPGSISFEFLNEGKEFVTRFRPLDISIILDNLIINSKKAGATKMKIDFRLLKNNVLIYFADNGKGVERKNEKYLFKRGFTTTNGSGIGLLHIQSMLKDMGGQVRFIGNNFEGLAKGACFEVKLK